MIRSCTRCSVQPGFHTFEVLGYNNHGQRIYYTAPSRNMEKTFTEESIANYLAHMDSTIGIDWVWIFDAAGLEDVDMPNPMLMRRFYKIIVERYGRHLKYIYMLHMNWKIDAIYKVIRTFSSEDTKRRVMRCREPVELVAAGIPVVIVEKVFGSRPI